MHILTELSVRHSFPPIPTLQSLSMQKTAYLSNLVLLLCLQTTAQAASTYSATLNCDAVQGGAGEPAFSAPLTLKVDGSTLSWSRESTSMREIVSGTVTDGKAVLDGYGGSVSAGTRQAFWDWKLAAQLQVTTQGVSGTAQLLSKDGRLLQRRCTVASVPAVMPAPSAAATPPAVVPQPVTGVAAAPPVQIKIPQAPAVAPAPQPPTPPEKVLSSVDAEQSAAKEAEIRRREAALARREQSVAKRERSIAQQQAKSSPPSVQAPSQPTKPASTPLPAQGPSKQPSVPTLGDI